MHLLGDCMTCSARHVMESETSITCRVIQHVTQRHSKSRKCHLSIFVVASMATLLNPAAALSTESPPFNPRVAGSIGSNGISGAMGGGSASAGAQPDNSNSNAIAKHTFSYNGCVMTMELLT